MTEIRVMISGAGLAIRTIGAMRRGIKKETECYSASLRQTCVRAALVYG